MVDTLSKSGGIQAAYCTDQFLVVWATGKPRYDPSAVGDYLRAIPNPPGGDQTCRVRTSADLLTVFKIPLQTQSLAPGSSNSIPFPLPNIPGIPAAGAVAMAVDGVPAFPNYNNRGQAAAVSCEIDRCNAHAGKGEDYHYHGDPFGKKCLYDESDYVGRTHPPVIGYALDGFLLYGRYISSSLEGVGVELDACGGHTHGDLGYHYHSTVTTGRTTNHLDGVSGSGPFSYTTYDLAPTTCWKGDVGKIANFWDNGHQAQYDRSKGREGPSSWTDYEQIRPCCGSTEYLVADGVALNGAGTCSLPSCNIKDAKGVSGKVTPRAPSSSSSSSSGGLSNSAAKCSGTDDHGRACPPDLNSDGLCPRGCTRVTNDSGIVVVKGRRSLRQAMYDV